MRCFCLRQNFSTLVCLISLALLFGCAEQTKPAPPSGRTVTDDLGRTVSLPLEVRRVVSLAPNLTEMVYAVGAGDRLVGVTTFCNYPPQAASVAKIGDTMNPNMESIVALKPDVVLVSTASQIETFLKTLEQNGIAVYVTNPLNLDDVFANLEKLGDLFGTRQVALRLITNLKVRKETIERERGEVRSGIFVQISNEPLFTIGRDSFLNDLLLSAGGRSVTADVATAYPKLSKETAVALRPDLILISESPDNQAPNEALRSSPAVRNGRVYKIDADILSRPGPRLVDALEQIAEKVKSGK